MEKAKVTGMLLVRQALDQYKLSERTIDIIMSSWRETTKQQYSSYISQCLHFCGQKQIDPLQTNVKFVLAFLTEFVDSGRSYSCENTARSALSSLIMYDNGVGIGKHPLVYECFFPNGPLWPSALTLDNWMLLSQNG